MPSLPCQPGFRSQEDDPASVPAEPIQKLLLELLQAFEEERAIAWKRHLEVLSRLREQKDHARMPEHPDFTNQSGQMSTTLVLPSKISGQHVGERSNQTPKNGEASSSKSEAFCRVQISHETKHCEASSSQSQSSPRVQSSRELKRLKKTKTVQLEVPPGVGSGSLDTKERRSIQFGSNGIVGSIERTVSNGNLVNIFSRAVQHDNFELVFAIVIMVNALVMCFDVQYRGLQIGSDMQYNSITQRADQTWPGAEKVFDVFDWIFGFLLSLEVLLRVAGFRCMYARDVWNYVDLICLLAFFIEKVASIMVLIGRQKIQLFRMFRLLRLIRLLRSLEGADGLYLLTTAIRGINTVLAWAVLLLSTLLMTCALFVTQVLHTFYFERTPVAEIPPEMYEYFGTFTRCMASMFELTLANWPPVARLLCEEVSEWFMLLCLIHKLTIGLAVIGVMNGAILQETFKVAATDDLIMVRQKKRAAAVFQTKMSRLFDALDSDGDGFLDYNEFVVIAGHPEVKHWLASMDIETDDLQTLFACVDVSKTGKVSVEDFLQQIPRMRGPVRTFDLLALQESIRNSYHTATQTLSETFADVGHRMRRHIS